MLVSPGQVVYISLRRIIYFPSHRHQVGGTNAVSSKRYRQSGLTKLPKLRNGGGWTRTMVLLIDSPVPQPLHRSSEWWCKLVPWSNTTVYSNIPCQLHKQNLVFKARFLRELLALENECTKHVRMGAQSSPLCSLHTPIHKFSRPLSGTILPVESM